jgi:DNA-binding MarR family transcriptional regulator
MIRGKPANPLSTVSAEALLDNGSDARFRQLILDLLHFGAQVRDSRDRLGGMIGLSGPAYAMLVTITRQDDGAGIRVRDVAARLHVTGAFVTAEANKLVKRELIEKRPDPGDRRGVLLSLTDAGRREMAGLAPKIRAVNDYFFGDMSRAEFNALCKLSARLGARSAVAFFEVHQSAA